MMIERYIVLNKEEYFLTWFEIQRGPEAKPSSLGSSCHLPLTYFKPTKGKMVYSILSVK